MYSSIRQMYCCHITDCSKVPPERAAYKKVIKKKWKIIALDWIIQMFPNFCCYVSKIIFHSQNLHKMLGQASSITHVTDMAHCALHTRVYSEHWIANNFNGGFCNRRTAFCVRSAVSPWAEQSLWFMITHFLWFHLIYIRNLVMYYIQACGNLRWSLELGEIPFAILFMGHYEWLPNNITLTVESQGHINHSSFTPLPPPQEGSCIVLSSFVLPCVPKIYSSME